MPKKSFKLASWNVNGIRAAHRGGFLDWLNGYRPDVVGLQEIKAFPEQLEEPLRLPKGYHALWNPAQKPGYSGTAILSKEEPLDVKTGLGIPKFDSEGRVLVAEFKDFVFVTAYFPNSQRDHSRLGYKLEFCDAMMKYCESARKKGKNFVLCGDFNIAHREIDLRNPKTNVNNAGFLPEERAWMDRFTDAGYVDTFREFEKGGGHYSWWSYRPGVREKNIGWRLDYHVINPELRDRLKSAEIQPDVAGSDHCPVAMELRV